MIIYRNFTRDSILTSLADIMQRFAAGISDHEDLIAGICEQVSRICALAEKYGFTDNIWHNYLAYLLATSENDFSLSCERRAAPDSSLSKMAREDFYLIRELFFYDFQHLENILRIECFTAISSYQPAGPVSQNSYQLAGATICQFSRELVKTESVDNFHNTVTKFYHKFGVGKFALQYAFRAQTKSAQANLDPVTIFANISLDDIIGYETQKARLIANTSAFISGRKANNLLLHGDSGTGKSTCIKAILNMFASRGLRVIEIYRHQYKYLTEIMDQVRERNYKFLFYLDDLSFEEFETDFKFLKAVIEGGLEPKPDNVLIYATSNRRHLIRETWTDRQDIRQEDDIHHSDTAEEKLSLVHRFGVTIYFPRPDEQQYLDIVKGIASTYPELQMPEDILLEKARRWGLWHGSISGRRARQFINHLLGTEEK